MKETNAELLARIKATLPQAVEVLRRRNAPLSFPGLDVARPIHWKGELHYAWPLVQGFAEYDGGLGVKWSVFLLTDGTLIRLHFGMSPSIKVPVDEVVCQRVLDSLTTIATFRSRSRFKKRY